MRKLKNWLRDHKKQLFIGGACTTLLIIVIQIIYPTSQLLPFATTETVSVGGMSKSDAVRKLDKVSAQHTIKLMLNDENKVIKTFKLSDVGFRVHNDTRVNSYDYPLIWRLIPTSLVWYHLLQTSENPHYERDEKKTEEFVTEQFGTDCVIKPQNATITVKGESLQVVQAKDGGTCSKKNVISRLEKLEIRLDQPSVVRIPVKVEKPNISTSVAEALAKKIENHTESDVSVTVRDSSVKITKKQLYSWLVFTAKNDKLIASLGEKKAKPYLDKSITPKVTIPAGRTTITTRDFAVLSTKNGAPGRTLDVTKTLEGIINVMLGEKDEATAVTTVLKPSVTYIRSYTKTSTGISAMLKHYDEDHAGVFGVSFVELGGRGLSAQHDSTKSFVTASTYKLFVAYDTLRKVEKDDWEWSDEVVGGRNLSTCFDDMIVKSDNACAEALYKKIGYKKVINDVRALGLTNTFLGSDGQETSAGDLALFLRKLYDGSIGLKSSSRDRLIDAMKRNMYRGGIPAGTSGAVANKVGFLNGLFHDASIVYSSKGNYVLVIMSDGSSWANIAEITKKIESLR